MGVMAGVAAMHSAEVVMRLIQSGNPFAVALGVAILAIFGIIDFYILRFALTKSEA